MKKVFLDCGTNLGQGLLKFINDKLIDESFEIHLFEPNPYALNETKKRLSDENYKKYNFIYHEVASWTEDCLKKMTLEAFDGDYVCQHTGEFIGKNLKSGGATNIMGDEWNKPDYIMDEWMSCDKDVKCIDFSSFLKNNINEEDFVLCKMDIEGAEFEVLGKLIDEDTINLMDGIYIEWHNHLLKTNYDISVFIDEINSRGIEVKSWI